MPRPTSPCRCALEGLSRTVALGMRKMTKVRVTASSKPDSWYKDKICHSFDVVWCNDLGAWAIPDDIMEAYGLPDQIIEAADCEVID